jgi:hypothetical protein
MRPAEARRYFFFSQFATVFLRSGSEANFFAYAFCFGSLSQSWPSASLLVQPFALFSTIA